MPPYLLLGLLILLGIIIWRRTRQSSGGFATGTLQFFGGETPSYIAYPNNAAYYPGTGSFTVETWIKMDPTRESGSSTNSAPRVFALSGTDISSGIQLLACSIEGNTSARTLYVWVNGANYTNCSFPVDNKWHHLAIVGNGGTNIRVYIDGTSIVSQNTAYDIVSGTFTSKHFNIGSYPEDPSPEVTSLVGYLSNFNYNPSTALYSGASFAVPTASPTAIASTKMLLLAVDETTKFTDSSSLNATATENGTPPPAWSSQTVGVGA